eukprot:Blabericola_migrator_1__2487@NODE_16_length_23467_cov_90_205256_g13_i0_p14_GENE_NODE_16_length_23467_cov_90_205256_g13_i0NODE_16_length_23467_cov_90_205256_g13_i0_p14_ORF_typecomplete_len120_score11_88DUF2471/PF10616_9/0_037_NODE_16_length_23467_cov_90_205256_g13_i057636122
MNRKTERGTPVPRDLIRCQLRCPIPAQTHASHRSRSAQIQCRHRLVTHRLLLTSHHPTTRPLIRRRRLIMRRRHSLTCTRVHAIEANAGEACVSSCTHARTNTGNFSRFIFDGLQLNAP